MPKEIMIVMGIFTLFLIASYIYGKIQDHSFKKRLKASFGQLETHEISGDYLDKLKFFFEQVSIDKAFKIDDITANDLDLDSLYNKINTANSQIGREYLYSALRHPKLNQDDLKKRQELVNYFNEQHDKLFETQYQLSKISGLPYYLSFYEQILTLKKEKQTWIHHIHFVALILSILLTVVVPEVGVPLLGMSLLFNVIHYLILKVDKSSSLNSFSGIVSASIAYDKIVRLNPDIFDKNLASRIQIFKRGIFVQEGSTTSEVSTFSEMIYSLTHINFLYYNHMLRHLQIHFNDLLELFEAIGEIEVAIVICQIKASSLPVVEPTFTPEEPLSIKGVIHPLIEDCVANDVLIDESLLVTGSNASGKSTYIKAIAINIILAQTLLISFSESYQGPFYKVLSSMALKDDIHSNESYFMVEIKSLNRIVNETQEDARVIGFIDEILRGTNTIERIAASAAVLKQFVSKEKRFVAATHDIELTKILEDDVKNLHFSETLKDNDIYFDYQVKQGPSQSRNAIKLLEISGYSSDITDQANLRVKEFETQGKWV